MDKSKTRGGQAPFPETPVLASQHRPITIFIEEFYRRKVHHVTTTFRALGHAAELTRAFQDERDWDAAFIRKNAEGSLQDVLLAYRAELDALLEEQSEAIRECASLRAWYEDRCNAIIDRQNAKRGQGGRR